MDKQTGIYKYLAYINSNSHLESEHSRPVSVHTHVLHSFQVEEASSKASLPASQHKMSPLLELIAHSPVIDLLQYCPNDSPLSTHHSLVLTKVSRIFTYSPQGCLNLAAAQ